jgi:amidase/aspartyl-tRNA(Asn)/glutamyl-tRNA(Gln) amidotransferase subunit A
MEARVAGFDALLSPTVAIVPPLLSDVAQGKRVTPPSSRPTPGAAQYQRGQHAGRVRLSLPCHVQGELPVGLMVWHAAGRDDAVLNVGQRIEELLQKQ